MAVIAGDGLPRSRRAEDQVWLTRGVLGGDYHFAVLSHSPDSVGVSDAIGFSQCAAKASEEFRISMGFEQSYQWRSA